MDPDDKKFNDAKKSDIRNDQSDGMDNDNIRILYITLGVMVGLLLLWIIMMTFTTEDSIKILREMNNITAQITPASDQHIILSQTTAK
jgi:dihydroorotase